MEGNTTTARSGALLFEQENLRAEQHIVENNLVDAAKILVAIAEKDPQNWRAFNNMGIIAWMKEAWDDAYSMFKRSVEIKPDYPDALINLFDAALKLRRVHLIIDNFEQAHRMLPDNEEVTILHEAMREEGDDIYTSQRAMKIGIFDPELDEAKKLLENGDLMPAMEKFLNVIDRKGPHHEAYCGLGIISYYQKRYEDAYSLFFESIKLNPTDPDIYLNLIDAAKECDQIDQARKIYMNYSDRFDELKSIGDEFESIAGSTKKS